MCGGGLPASMPTGHDERLRNGPQTSGSHDVEVRGVDAEKRIMVWESLRRHGFCHFRALPHR